MIDKSFILDGLALDIQFFEPQLSMARLTYFPKTYEPKISESQVNALLNKLCQLEPSLRLFGPKN